MSATIGRSSPSTKRSPRALLTGLSLLSIWLLFACVVAWHIELPGLYMDAVNPDYLVIDVLHGHTDASPIWILPGNFIGSHFPLLTSIYHGTLQVWLAAPLVGMFGPSVASLRASQAVAGAAILAGIFFLLRRRRPVLSWWLAWLPAATLALDPVFVYAFRTQLYITLSPVALLFAAILAAERALPSTPLPDQGGARPYKPAWLVLSGLCYGLALFGYFVYSFFAPALLIGMIIACKRIDPNFGWVRTDRVLLWTALGAVIGTAGFAVGYLRIMQDQNGTGGFVAWFSGYQHAIGAFETHTSLAATASYFATLVWRVFSNHWQHSLMFHDGKPEPFSVLKLLLLLGLPLAIWIWCEVRRVQAWRLRLIVGLIACFPIVALAFGDRLSGHHFVALLPLGYLALGTGFAELATIYPGRPPIKIVVVAVWVVLSAINLVGLHSTGTELLRTHGRGLFSDAINHYASDAIAQENSGNKQHVYLPDWGLFMPFHFLTDGRIRHSTDLNVNTMHDELCRGQNITVALITGDVAARFSELASQLSWTPPKERRYLDHEGHEVFTVGVFDASARGPAESAACLHEASRQ